MEGEVWHVRWHGVDLSGDHAWLCVLLCMMVTSCAQRAMPDATSSGDMAPAQEDASLQIYDGSDVAQSFAIFGGDRYRLYPFERVDCSKECGAPGWHEIHTLVERDRDDALGFIIFYLRNPGQVEGHYSMVWPGFEVITPQTLPATWTSP